MPSLLYFHRSEHSDDFVIFVCRRSCYEWCQWEINMSFLTKLFWILFNCFSPNFSASKFLYSFYEDSTPHTYIYIFSYLKNKNKVFFGKLDNPQAKASILKCVCRILKALFLVLRVNMLSVTSSKMQLQSALNNFELPARGCIQKGFHRPVSKFTSTSHSRAKSHLSYVLAVRSWWKCLDISCFSLLNIPSRSKNININFPFINCQEILCHQF